MSVTLFAANYLEAATTVGVTPAALATRPITRVYDRIRGLPYQGGSVAQTDIDIDLGATPPAITGLALLNHTITGVTVSIRADTTSPGTTERATHVATGADAIVTFASQTFRYWRIRIPVMAAAPTIGELLLGVPRTISDPFLATEGVATLGNVIRRRTPAGYVAATRLSESRAAIGWGWNILTDAEVVLLQTAYAEAEEGAKPLVVKDELGAIRWMAWVAERLDPVPIGLGQNEIAGIAFEGAP